MRADNIRRLSDEGWQALVDHGVRRVIDLRFPEELAEDAPRDAPVEVVHISLLGTEHSGRIGRPSSTPCWIARGPQRSTSCGRTRSSSSDTATGSRWRSRQLRMRRRDPSWCTAWAERTGPASWLRWRCDSPAGSVTTPLRTTRAARRISPSRHAAWVETARNATERRRREMLVPTPRAAMRAVLEELDRLLRQRRGLSAWRRPFGGRYRARAESAACRCLSCATSRRGTGRSLRSAASH